ncbi:hypothetical protein WQ88_00945 [Escherichia coli]|nr:hypothetical protein WQ88_00945 [Escherichia coli]
MIFYYQPEAPYMLNTCRVPLTDRKVKEKRAMKQHKAMIVALIVICIAAEWPPPLFRCSHIFNAP